MPDPVELRISQRRVLISVFVVCVGIELLLVFLDYHVNYGGWTDIRPLRQLVNITREDGLPGWFAPVQTLLVALTVWLIWAVDRCQQSNAWRSSGWAIVAAFFTYMAIDDGAKVHERLGTAFRVASERGGEAGSVAGTLLGIFPSYTWQIVFLPAFAALGLFTLVFLWRQLGDRLSRALVVTGLGCFVVAVGLDFVEGLDRRHPLNFHPWLVDQLDLYQFSRRRFGRPAFQMTVHFGKSLEETLEMFGTTLFWLAFLRYLMLRTCELRLRFVDREPQGQ